MFKYTFYIKIIFAVIAVLLFLLGYRIWLGSKAEVTTYKHASDITQELLIDLDLSEANNNLRNNIKPAEVITNDLGPDKIVALTFDGLPNKTTLDRLLKQSK